MRQNMAANQPSQQFETDLQVVQDDWRNIALLATKMFSNTRRHSVHVPVKRFYCGVKANDVNSPLSLSCAKAKECGILLL